MRKSKGNFDINIFKISSPLDQKDALIIYVGKEIAGLAKSLLDPGDSEDVRDAFIIYVGKEIAR